MAKVRPSIHDILTTASNLESEDLANTLRLCAGQSIKDFDLNEFEERLTRMEKVHAVLERAEPLLDEQTRRLVNAILDLEPSEVDACLDEHRVLAESRPGDERKRTSKGWYWSLEHRGGERPSLANQEEVSVRLFQHFGEVIQWKADLSWHAKRVNSLEEAIEVIKIAELPSALHERHRARLQRKLEVFIWLNEHYVLRK